jgi:phosphohistidine phosphatase
LKDEDEAAGEIEMHVLHLLRHAKSSWSDDADDHERALSRRGREAARLVGRDFGAEAALLDLVLCSSARRTRETLELLFERRLQRPVLAIEDELYLASGARLMRRLAALDESTGAVLVIGHNPGLYELAMMLASPRSRHFAAFDDDKFPTAARVSLALAAPWSALERAAYEIIAYVPAGGERSGEAVSGA